MADIKLTLGDIPAAPDASAAMAMQEKPVEKPKPAEPVFTAEEQQMIDDFSKQIDINQKYITGLICRLFIAIMQSIGGIY